MAKKIINAQVIIIMVLILMNFFKVMIVDGSSMAPTLVDGSFIITKKVVTGETIKKDDIVVFYCKQLNMLCIKRVTGVAGDTIEYYSPIDEALGVVTVGEGEIFVEGDNYFDSIDSRYSELGPISLGDVRYKLIFNSHLPWWLFLVNIALIILLAFLLTGGNDEEQKSDSGD